MPRSVKSHQARGYWIYGKFPVLQALKNPRRKIYELIVSEKVKKEIDSDKELSLLIKTRGVIFNVRNKNAIDGLVGSEVNHQSYLLR